MARTRGREVPAARPTAGTRREPWAPGRVTVVLVALAAVALGVVAGLRAPPQSGVWARYPEAWRASSEASDALEGALSDRQAAWRMESDEAVARAVGSADRPDALGIVRAWLAADGGKSLHVSRLASPVDDGKRLADAAFVASHPSPEADALLLRMARDRGLHPETRVRTFAALCRPGNAAGLDALANVVLDLDEAASVRREALVRMPRLALPLAPRLRSLLDLPFHHMDLCAAAVLGSQGPVESPTLVLAMLRWAAPDMSRFRFAPETLCAIQVVRRLAAGDARLLAAAAAAEERVRSGALPDFVTDPGTPRDAPTPVGALADAFAAWLDAHPQARDTPWERRHAERVDAAHRTMVRLRTAEDVLACPDESIDVVAAVQVAFGEGNDATRESVMVDIDRLADWLRPHVAACAAPRAKLAAMQGLLVPRRQVIEDPCDATDVRTVLYQRAGNCVSWTLVFLDIGDRLGLPLRPVRIPGHVYVRWDDGRESFNWDPLYGGVSLTDEEAVQRFCGPATPAASAHADLVTRRQLVSIAISNTALYWLGQGDRAVDFAIRTSEVADRLDPTNSAARLCLMGALAQAWPPRTEHLRRAVRHAMEGATGDDVVLGCALALAAGGAGDDALALLARNPPADAGTRRARYIRASALCSAGRGREGRALADALAAEDPEDVEAATLAAACAFGVSPEDGWEALRRTVVRWRDSDATGFLASPRRLRLLVGVAHRLLRDAPATERRARLAAEIASLVGPHDRDAAAPSAPAAVRDLLLGPSDVRWSEFDGERDEILARTWERVGDPERAAAIRKAARERR